ncbi:MULTISPECIES: YciI family protein [Amycolatopsis]|uniref:YciI family protein n=1 Tax=Amycolatopsis albidoflavus TaxID=102226 RepID=A0ABW5HTN2_9PSEU
MRQTLLVKFFCYHRDRPGSAALRAELIEEHWSYMDGFELIARGPTLDGEIPTGSVHIVDLPDAAAVREFAFAEPNYQAGAYRDVLIRRWDNALGRTMWEFPGDPEAANLYLVLGLGSGAAVDLEPSATESLIAYGPLWSVDCTAWLGTAALVQAADVDTARGILTSAHYAAIEVHDWRPGGRP